VRYRVNAKQRAAAHPFKHTVMVRPTDFRPLRPANPNVRQQFHELYEELIADEERNQLICHDLIQTLREGRSPLVLTERNEHLDSWGSACSARRRKSAVAGFRLKSRKTVICQSALTPCWKQSMRPSVSAETTW
jgi:hypothetical protein